MGFTLICSISHLLKECCNSIFPAGSGSNLTLICIGIDHIKDMRVSSPETGSGGWSTEG